MFMNYIKEEHQRPNIHINGTIILKLRGSFENLIGA